MSWDRYELGQKNIFYDESPVVFPAMVLPPHVDRVRRSILDFSCVLRGQHNPFRSSLEGHNVRSLVDKSDPDPTFKAAQKTLFEARYAESVFSLETNAYSIPRETNERWDLFKKNGTTGFGFFESLKSPQPDQAFYLPIYHSAKTIGIPNIVDPEARQWHQAPDPSVVEPFSWSTLKKLHEFGLQPAPSRIFEKPPREANLKCYPWLVVEHKKEMEEARGPERVVCCQAANAAAYAVNIVRQSAQYAVELPGQAQIPPIPVITTIGPCVRVWIMYFAKDFNAPCSQEETHEVTTKRRKEGYIMRTVWNGDMTKLADIVKLQMILENTHTWAMRAFKPLVSSYLEQWIHVHLQQHVGGGDVQSLWNESKSRRQKTIDQRRAVLPMVQSLLEDHDQAIVELDDTAHRKVTPLLLGLLMHQICLSERDFISSEVDRAVTDKVKALGQAQEIGVTHNARTCQTGQTTRVTIGKEHGKATFSFRSSLATQEPVTDNDDPNDSDYRQSQATSNHSQLDDKEAETDADADADDDASEAEGSVALSSDLEFCDHANVIWRAPDEMETPRARLSTSLLPDRPTMYRRDSAPLSGSTVTGSTKTTPRPTAVGARLGSDPAPQSAGSPRRSQYRARVTAGKPAGSPVFAGRSPPGQRGWSPGRQFGLPQPSKSPQPPDAQPTSGEDGKPMPEAGDTHRYIDLTNESQDSC
ncbi:hypothetical protein FZEAL_9973 [Fusarium zealandicum]|uniref:Uncharacterized protein n=1 Tax=Fusarium zealandicum TaxID=1053134 RepID=A0A8H4XDW7_9HYPO|nr:hypothetical protein FZEAL_9973 [Fusarium zealandicum]